MPSIRYINQSAPFWDFIANMENDERPSGRFDGPPGMWPHSGQQYPFRTRDEQQQRRQEAGREGVPSDNTAAPNADGGDGKQPSEKATGENAEAGASANANGNGNEDAPPRYRRCGGGGHRSGGGCGRRWAGRCGHRGGPGGYEGPHYFRGFGGSSRCGPFSSGAGAGAGFGPTEAIPFFLGPVADFLRSHLGDLDSDGTPGGSHGDQDSKGQSKASGAAEAPQKDHVPEADVFDTETAFIVHVSLPGAKKEDVGVNWDPEKSELSVAGVVYRPADEDMLKTLALDDRRVGPFERRVRLGTRASPAMIEADGITARLEEGILKVEIPKLDRDYVDIKKVDIE